MIKAGHHNSVLYSLKPIVAILAFSLSLSLILFTKNTSAMVLTGDNNRPEVTYNNSDDSFSFRATLTSSQSIGVPTSEFGTGTTVFFYTAEVQGKLIAQGGDKYSGNVSGELVNSSISGVYEEKSDPSPCSATVTLTVATGNVSYSNLNCGQATEIDSVDLDRKGEALKDGATTSGSESTSEVDSGLGPCTANWGMSWVTCTLVDNLLQINNGLYKLIRGMLEFPAALISSDSGSDSPVYEMWKVFRNVANTVLLFAFIVIIFSQATSVGLSAYGVKKLLPRVMAFAILVNLSFIICQILVDASNITGQGINETVGKAALSTLSEGVNAPSECKGKLNLVGENGLDETELWQCAMNMTKSKANISAGAALTVALFPGAVIALVVVAVLIAFLAIVVGFAVLILRQAIIIAMVILAPVAIAAAILPGTKKLYDFWKNTFASMLFMFPIISLLFAGSNLIAVILGSVNFFEGIPGAEQIASYMTVLIVMIMLVAPWFLIPFVVKISGGMLGKAMGAIDKISGAKLAREKAAGAGKDIVKDRANVARTKMLNSNSKMARRLGGAGFIARKQARDFNKTELDRAKAGAAAGHITREGSPYSKAQQGQAREVTAKLEAERATRQFAFELGGDINKALEEAINNGDYHLMNVTLDAAGAAGDTKTIESALKSMAGNNKFKSEDIQGIANNLMSKHAPKIDSKDIGMNEKLKAIAGADKKDRAAVGRAAEMSSSDSQYVKPAVGAKSNLDLASHKQLGDLIKAGHISPSKVTEIYNNPTTNSAIRQENKPYVESIVKAQSSAHTPPVNVNVNLPRNNGPSSPYPRRNNNP